MGEAHDAARGARNPRWNNVAHGTRAGLFRSFLKPKNFITSFFMRTLSQSFMIQKIVDFMVLIEIKVSFSVSYLSTTNKLLENFSKRRKDNG